MVVDEALTTIFVRDGHFPGESLGVEYRDRNVFICETVYDVVALLEVFLDPPVVLLISAWTWFKSNGILGPIARHHGVHVICWVKNPWDLTRLFKASPGGLKPDEIVQTDQQILAVLHRFKTTQASERIESHGRTAITIDQWEISAQEMNALLAQDWGVSGVTGGV